MIIQWNGEMTGPGQQGPVFIWQKVRKGLIVEGPSALILPLHTVL